MIFFDPLFSIQLLLYLPPYLLTILRTDFWHHLQIDQKTQYLHLNLFKLLSLQLVMLQEQQRLLEFLGQLLELRRLGLLLELDQMKLLPQLQLELKSKPFLPETIKFLAIVLELM